MLEKLKKVYLKLDCVTDNMLKKSTTGFSKWEDITIIAVSIGVTIIGVIKITVDYNLGF